MCIYSLCFMFYNKLLFRILPYFILSSCVWLLYFCCYSATNALFLITVVPTKIILIPLMQLFVSSFLFFINYYYSITRINAYCLYVNYNYYYLLECIERIVLKTIIITQLLYLGIKMPENFGKKLFFFQSFGKRGKIGEY